MHYHYFQDWDRYFKPSPETPDPNWIRGLRQFQIGGIFSSSPQLASLGDSFCSLRAHGRVVYVEMTSYCRGSSGRGPLNFRQIVDSTESRHVLGASSKYVPCCNISTHNG